MRSNILAHQLRSLSATSVLLAAATLVSACSKDAARFDQMLTSSIPKTANQKNIINGQQGYSTGTINNTSLAPVVSRSALPAASTDKQGITIVKPAQTAATSVPALPKYQAPNNALVLSKRKAPSGALRQLDTDKMTTGSVKSVASTGVEKTIKKPVGWKNNKGAWVTIKKGETLHNLSRRYGVPVMAIMSVNNIRNANTVISGQRILIPTYNYANTVPVSAPDNNPVTKASRSSRGFQGQARNVVAVPKSRAKKAVPVAETQVKSSTPTSKIATTKGGDYIVQSGDTLTRIARRFSVSVSSLRFLNELKKDNLRIGQRLNIPSAGKAVVSANKLKKSADPVTTGSITGEQVSKKRVKPVYSAPSTEISIAARANEKVETVAKTSAGTFRWPARGRIISKYGQRTSSGVNDGIDISMPVGTPIKASENGTVIYSGSELEDFGKLILLSHDGGWVTAYAHASSTLVRRGEKVRRGQVIAKSGRTGNATTPRLHFEIRKNSRPTNPLSQLGK